MVKKLWQYVKPFSSNTGTSRTDRRTDRQTDRRIELLYQYRASVCWCEIKQVYRRRYESRRSSKPKLHFKNNKIWRKTIFNMADGILTPCNVARGSGMTCHWIRPNVRRIGIQHLVSISTIITAVDMSLCTSLRNFIQIGPPSAEKNDVMSIFKMADFSHFGF